MAIEIWKSESDDAEWLCFGLNIMNQMINVPKPLITNYAILLDMTIFIKHIKHKALNINLLGYNEIFLLHLRGQLSKKWDSLIWYHHLLGWGWIENKSLFCSNRSKVEETQQMYKSCNF